jgi:hypothetical protein
MHWVDGSTAGTRTKSLPVQVEADQPLSLAMHSIKIAAGMAPGGG